GDFCSCVPCRLRVHRPRLGDPHRTNPWRRYGSPKGSEAALEPLDCPGDGVGRSVLPAKGKQAPGPRRIAPSAPHPLLSEYAPPPNSLYARVRETYRVGSSVGRVSGSRYDRVSRRVL